MAGYMLKKLLPENERYFHGDTDGNRVYCADQTALSGNELYGCRKAFEEYHDKICQQTGELQ